MRLRSFQSRHTALSSLMNFNFVPFGWIFMVLFWALVIAGIVALIKWLAGKAQFIHPSAIGRAKNSAHIVAATDVGKDENEFFFHTFIVIARSHSDVVPTAVEDPRFTIGTIPLSAHQYSGIASLLSQ